MNRYSYLYNPGYTYLFTIAQEEMKSSYLCTCDTDRLCYYGGECECGSKERDSDCPILLTIIIVSVVGDPIRNYPTESNYHIQIYQGLSDMTKSVNKEVPLLIEFSIADTIDDWSTIDTYVNMVKKYIIPPMTMSTIDNDYGILLSRRIKHNERKVVGIPKSLRCYIEYFNTLCNKLLQPVKVFEEKECPHIKKRVKKSVKKWVKKWVKK